MKHSLLPAFEVGGGDSQATLFPAPAMEPTEQVIKGGPAGGSAGLCREPGIYTDTVPNALR